MKIRKPWLLAALFICCNAVRPLHAQLVADGATATISSSTNVTGKLTIGTNGSFTRLVITSNGAVTNTGSGAIGLNASARTNRVFVTTASSIWNCVSDLAIGSSGSFNELVITNGGTVFCSLGNIGLFDVSAFNSVTVSGTNSLWSVAGSVNVGNSGPSNRLVIARGAKVESDYRPE